MIDTSTAEIFIKSFFSYFNLVYSIIPSGILIVLNILILRSLKEHLSEIKTANDTKSKDSMKIVVRRLSKMSIIISTAFIILTLPLGIFHELINKTVVIISDVKLDLIFDIFFIFNLFNHFINFIFNCICGQTFRIELQKFFCKLKKENGMELSSKSLTVQTAT